MKRGAAIIFLGLAITFAGIAISAAESLSDALSILKEQDGASRAKPILEKLIAETSRETDREKAQFYLSGCEYQLGNINHAFWMLDRLGRGASSENLRAAALLRLAMLRMEQGQDMEGLASYEALARQFSKSKYAPMAIMVQANYWLLIKGDKTRSLSLYESLVQKHPFSEEAKLALSTLPGLRKMTPSEIRKTSEKYVKDMKATKLKLNKTL